MNTKFKAKAIWLFLMAMGLLFKAGDVFSVHAMKRCSDSSDMCWSGLPHQMCRLGEDSNFGSTQTALCEIWFKMLAVDSKLVLDKFLITHGKQCVNWENSAGITSLNYAIDSGADSGVIDLLLENGADIDSIDASGRTPLVCAVDRLLERRAVSGFINPNDRDVVELLLNRGADIHMRDSDGNTGFHKVCMIGDLAITNRCLSMGGDSTDQNDDGLTPIDVFFEAVDKSGEALCYGTEVQDREKPCGDDIAGAEMTY